MTAQTIYLIRHGQVESNVLVLDRQVTVNDFNNIVAHVPHEALNEKGKDQVAGRIPQILQYDMSCLYASPLLRAQQTAKILADAINVPIITRNDLYELVPAPLHGPATREHTLKSAYIRSGLRLGNPFTRDTETVMQCLHRVRRAFLDLTKENRTSFGIVGHQGIFRLLFMWIHLSPNWQLIHGDTANSGISIISRKR